MQRGVRSCREMLYPSALDGYYESVSLSFSLRNLCQRIFFIPWHIVMRRGWHAIRIYASRSLFCPVRRINRISAAQLLHPTRERVL